jgi:hypothetical protein
MRLRRRLGRRRQKDAEIFLGYGVRDPWHPGHVAIALCQDAAVAAIHELEANAVMAHAIHDVDRVAGDRLQFPLGGVHLQGEA